MGRSDDKSHLLGQVLTLHNIMINIEINKMNKTMSELMMIVYHIPKIFIYSIYLFT